MSPTSIQLKNYELKDERNQQLRIKITMQLRIKITRTILRESPMGKKGNSAFY
jgi:hypothetical protein